jgi:hypothetical protein
MATLGGQLYPRLKTFARSAADRLNDSCHSIAYASLLLSPSSIASLVPPLPEGGTAMKRLIRIERDVRENQVYRDILLSQPEDFYQRYFGYVPDPVQKLFLVEQTIQATMAPREFVNDVYRVKVRKSPPVVHLDISRHDGQPICSWRDMQQIKNELVGPECEAIDLFPAESRLVDTAHQYHLWVIEDPTFRFPFGYDNRMVLPQPMQYNEQTVGTAARIAAPGAGGGAFEVLIPHLTAS